MYEIWCERNGQWTYAGDCAGTWAQALAERSALRQVESNRWSRVVVQLHLTGAVVWDSNHMVGVGPESTWR